MSKQEEVGFLTKLFGAFFGGFVFFLILVNSPKPGDLIQSTPSSSSVDINTSTPSSSYTSNSRSTSSRSYTSNYGTSSEKLGGSSNPFTQAKGFNEEDALIYAILKSEGYSHEDAAIATMKSAW